MAKWRPHWHFALPFHNIHLLLRHFSFSPYLAKSRKVVRNSIRRQPTAKRGKAMQCNSDPWPTTLTTQCYIINNTWWILILIMLAYNPRYLAYNQPKMGQITDLHCSQPPCRTEEKAISIPRRYLIELRRRRRGIRRPPPSRGPVGSRQSTLGSRSRRRGRRRRREIEEGGSGGPN